MTTRRAAALLVFLAAAGAGVAASAVPWDQLTEADWLYSIATRFATIDGHRVHYPTPPAELAELLVVRSETDALRQLADARLALGDKPGALAALEKWATAAGPEAWAETARWAAAHLDMPAAFRAADLALKGLAPAARRTLADDRIKWADAYPDAGDPIAMRKARAELFPDAGGALEEWLRALEEAGRLKEADEALASARALTPERRLLVRADLLADHGDDLGAFKVLDAAVAEPWSADFRRAYTRRVDRAAAGAPETWRAAIDARPDMAALVRLATYFQGQGRKDAVADLLRQTERRHAAALTRPAYLLMARLQDEIGDVAEAFRARLAAAHAATTDEQTADLADLARLALRAGDRPLAWGVYNDETYRWAARVDRTPGFWTGGVSFLLTGLDWDDALGRLERGSMADRTFAAGRALVDELVKRAPRHTALPSLRTAVMERFVDRGEGKAALALLPQVEAGPPADADEGRRIALLAARQVDVPLAEEVRLFKARLRYNTADGGQPDLGQSAGGDQGDQPDAGESDAGRQPWRRVPRPSEQPTYGTLLNEAIDRLESRDRSHRASLDLALSEMDRLPNAEALWLDLAGRLEGWNLDDELGPRYESALARFQGAGIWARAARWYAARSRHADLRRLAADIASRFRDAAIFARTRAAGEIRVEIPDQPPLGTRVRLVLWADWVRLEALKRFPQSPLVFREARRLVSETAWRETGKPASYKPGAAAPVVAPDALLETRRWALLFVDAGVREEYFANAMKNGTLEATVTAFEKRPARTPVEDLLIFEGWARLSRFERAVASADAVAAAYPGDGPLAGRVLSLHRSLNGLDAAQAASARALVARTAPALVDPAPLWTALGELEEESGRPQSATAVWQQIVDREPRSAARISELATLLWDYGHSAEALQIVEAGRTRLKRPRFFAFEAGVLHEEVKDIAGAVREYLEAVWPENGVCFCSAFESDQRSLRRLAQLLSRDRVFRLVEQRIGALKPGVADAERALASYFPLATIELPDVDATYDADDWIDAMDMPNDPAGRAARDAARDKNRPQERDAIRRAGDVLLEKAQAMVGQASSADFLDAVERWSRSLVDTRWAPDRAVDFRAAMIARRAELATTEEERIRLEVDRAQFLAEHGRTDAADAVWAALSPRIGALPEGVPKLRAESARAGYIERTKGADAAAAEWQRIGTAYPWSLGLLEDRLAFLARAGRGTDARDLLEHVVPSAASGHRVALLERLINDSLAAPDLPRAGRAVGVLLAERDLSTAGRINAVHLLARLSFKERPTWDPFPTVKAEAAKLPAEQHPDLYAALARAADLEQAWGTAVSLWIEALNRRTDRDWIQAACRSASRAGKRADLVGFFETQYTRSPRDARWAVAIRDIRRAFHIVDGAIEAAKAAVSIRPEQEGLWREAADLLVRADRIREAADFIAGWQRPRPADEEAAGWRSGLYARAGDGARALAVEQTALSAFAKEAPASDEESRRHLGERRARAAQRLLGYGLPAQAFTLISPKRDVRDLASSGLSVGPQCEIALLTGQFVPMLAARAGEEDFRQAAATFVATHARREFLEELQAFVLGQISPADATAPNQAALERWWRFAVQAGIGRSVSTALAGRLLARSDGPWRAGTPPLIFQVRVGDELVHVEKAKDGAERLTFVTPDLERMWVEDLVRRDQADALLAFLEPRWRDLMARVRGTAAITGDSPRLPWASWLDAPEALAVWASAVSARQDMVRELSDVMATRRLWDRFWALAARPWDAPPLVSLLPPEPRTAWFRFWEPAPPNDPVLRARRDTIEKVSDAVGRLVSGDPGALDPSLLARLRGPRTVGDVVGRDAAWTWPELVPRRNPAGEIVEAGDDRVTGQGADQGRVPGALWGDRPGEAWYVLETLARYREKDRTAALVPVEVPVRGRETERTLLAMRLAQAMGDTPLALDLAATYPGSDQDLAWLSGYLRLLAAAGQKDKARTAFRAHLGRVQPKLTEDGYRGLAALAEDVGLPAPVDLLDASRPVGPAFLAYLYDRRFDVARRFRTADEVGFRTALAHRWSGRESQLSASQVRFWLDDLWVTGSADLPGRGLVKLGGLWPYAAAWLRAREPRDRRAALDAVGEVAASPGAGGPPPRLLALLGWQDEDDTTNLLALRVHLLRGEDAEAYALVDRLLARIRRGEPLGLVIPEPAESQPAAEASAETSAEPEPAAAPAIVLARERDRLVVRLRSWLRPFRDVKKAGPVEDKFRALLEEQREEGPVSPDAWRLAFELTPVAARPALVTALDEAWFRGHVAPEDLGVIAATLASLVPGETARWLARWPREIEYGQTEARATILLQMKDASGAARLLFETRRRVLWSTQAEIAAFDLWRRTGAPAGAGDAPPGAWAAAGPFWTAAAADTVLPGLGAHLQDHPHDFLASRAAFRSVAPGGDEDLLRVSLTLGGAVSADRRRPDQIFLALRAARGFLPRSWRAARAALGPVAIPVLANDLVLRRLPSAAINAALADVARVASKGKDEAQLAAVLTVLANRQADNARSLRAELEADRPPMPSPYRLVDGRPAPIRPRDFTWPMLSNLLMAEGVR